MSYTNLTCGELIPSTFTPKTHLCMIITQTSRMIPKLQSLQYIVLNSVSAAIFEKMVGSSEAHVQLFIKKVKCEIKWTSPTLIIHPHG